MTDVLPTPEAQDVDAGPVRYGVFLRPSPALIDESLRGYRIAREQFGFAAANAYPPHVTIVGSIAITGDESALVEALNDALVGQPALAVHSAGLGLVNQAVGYQLTDATGHEGELAGFMGRVLDAVRPLRVFPTTDRTTAQRLRDAPSTFRPHLSVIGHDGAERPEAVAECLEVFTALGMGAPVDWDGTVVTLYRFRSRDWTDRYWETMTWEAVTSWHLV